MIGINSRYYDDLKQLCKDKADFNFNNLNFNTLIDKYLKDVLLVWKVSKPNKLSFLTEDGNCDNANVFRIIDFIFLIKYLEDKGYVYIQKRNYSYNEKDKFRILYNDKKIKIKSFDSSDGNIYFESNCMGIPIFCLRGKVLNTDIGNLLNRYIGSLIYPSFLLDDFVNNDFKTIEQKRFKKQCILTSISIVISFFIGLASILINACNSCKFNTANTEQYEGVEQEIHGIQTILKDTLQIKPIYKDSKIK